MYQLNITRQVHTCKHKHASSVSVSEDESDDNKQCLISRRQKHVYLGLHCLNLMYCHCRDTGSLLHLWHINSWAQTTRIRKTKSLRKYQRLDHCKNAKGLTTVQMSKGCPHWKYHRLGHSEHVKDLTTPNFKLFIADSKNAKDLTIAKILNGRFDHNESSKDSAITTVKNAKDWVDYYPVVKTPIRNFLGISTRSHNNDTSRCDKWCACHHSKSTSSPKRNLNLIFTPGVFCTNVVV